MKKETTPFSIDPKAETFLELALSFERSISFIVALELDLFSVIGEDFKSAEEIAEKIGASPKGIFRLLNALVAMGLLVKYGQKYGNTQEGKEYLVRGAPNYFGDARLMRFLLKRWLNLKETIIGGQPYPPLQLSTLTSDEIDGMLFIMNWRANRQAPEFIRFIDTSKVMKAIDFGCGSGSFGLELLKININIELVLFDYPEIVPFTERFVEKKGFAGFAKVMQGDLLSSDIGKDYDLAIVSNVLRYFSFKDCMKILNKIFDALKRKGRIVVQENLIDNDRTSPFFATFDSLRLLLFTPNGDLLTETELLLMMKEAWFSDIKIHKTSYGSTIFIGEK
ncbi:MAG: methyltransferase [Ignavibacteria bacterium]|nr:methyltransferase [Ignavibacteria bacterium]